MKKKFLIGSILPALVGTAIVGTGFSLWFFNDASTSTEQGALNKNVTQLVEIGSITKADDFTMVFDQANRAKDLANADLEAKGIYLDFGSKTNTNKVAKYNKPTDAGAVDIINGSTKVVFKTTIKFSNELDTYVSVAYDTTGNFTHSTETKSFSYELTFDSTTAENNMVFDWTKVAFSYAENKEPTDKDQYESFKKLVEASTINVTYTATLVGAKTNA